MTGPFNLSAIQALSFTSHDNTPLRGWLFLPDLPNGTKAPVVLVTSPYHGGKLGGPDRNSDRGAPIDFLVARGYAVAEVSVRGTGLSGGCFESKGLNEQLDQVALVEFLAEQPWSNGRVAMTGLSYRGTTPLMAARFAPEALKTVVVMGPVTDPYTELATPQGAFFTVGGVNEIGRRASVTAAPVPDGWHDGSVTPVDPRPERACPGVVAALSTAERAHVTDDRDAAFWNERRLIDGFPNVTAAVFFTHGFQEIPHPFQEDAAFHAFTQAPTRFLLGQWGHDPPRVDDWRERLVTWLDYWLKGVGEAPVTPVVDWQDDGGAWHASAAWPPPEARDEVLYVATDALAPAPGGAVAFQSVPVQDQRGPAGFLCPDARHAGRGVAFLSAPFADDALIAGNPFAYLSLSADEPGGLVAVHVLAVGAAGCEDARVLGHGVADLRFHAGNLVGRDFPVASRTAVRVDVTNFAATVARGERVAVVLSQGEFLSDWELVGLAQPVSDQRASRSGQPFFPTVTVHEASHVVLPFVTGSLGGAAPTATYPRRPFTPVP